MEESRPQVSRRRVMETTVVDVVMETHDTATIVMATKEDVRGAYKAGQFITIDPHQFLALGNAIAYLETEKGSKEPPRAYSLASTPTETTLATTVKVEPYVPGQTKYPPLLSPYLAHGVAKGQKITVSGFSGAYCFDETLKDHCDHVIHVSAGSGIVPNYAMIKWALEAGLPVKHTLVYGNKTWDDVIYRAQFDALVERFPDRLRVIHALSREADLTKFTNGGKRDVRGGRIGEALLREVIEDKDAVLVYTCGPAITKWEKVKARAEGKEATPRFLETVLASLDAIGLAKERLHKEAYG